MAFGSSADLFSSTSDLHSDASIQYASESIVDVLGYSPEEVVGKSCFDYFHPDEVPFARGIHSRGVMLDKASVLHYARIKDCNGNYVGCECVFSVVHDVLVACTSVYKGDEKSRRKCQMSLTWMLFPSWHASTSGRRHLAADLPTPCNHILIRYRARSSSPRDPSSVHFRTKRSSLPHA